MTFRRCYGCMNTVEGDTCPHCGCEGTLQNQAHQLPVGTVLKEQFLVGRALGQGGFGITYIGMDIHLERVVAIKEFYPAAVVNRDVSQSSSVQLNTADSRKQYEDNRDRFLREARALAKLDAVEEVVSVRSMFQENNTAYIIMEYVQGTDLRHYVRDRGGALTLGELLPLMEPVLRALHSVHKAGLVHRDVSPDNIMILPDGKAKLLDFGAVRDWTDADADMDLSHSTEAILKHGFAPMEQYRSRGNLGPWTDEYGICASFYYCLTGRVPPDAPARAMGEEDVDWSALPGLQNRQRRALEKGMSMRAKDRFGDLEALRKALYEESAPASKPETKTPQTATATVKRKKGRGALIAALLLLIALGAGAAWFLNREAPEPAMEAVPTETSRVTHPVPTETAEALVETVAEATEETVASLSADPALWRDNVMAFAPIARLEALGTARETIVHVTFLDTLADAPENTADVSAAGNGSVRGWVDWTDACHVYFAAEGGINGEQACTYLFTNCIGLKTVEFGNAFHTDYTGDMSMMFNGCSSLESVDVQNLNTASAKTMANMFNLIGMQMVGGVPQYLYNETLEFLDLNSWDVSKVEDMSYMFYGTHALRTVRFPDWNLSSVKNMKYMFGESGLMDFVAANWVLPKEGSLDMSLMFHRCYDLIAVRAAGWDTSRVENMSGMFSWCAALETLDVGNWNLENVRDMSKMFLNCGNLKTLDVKNWKLGKVADMSELFCGCSGLQGLDVGAWDVSGVTRMTGMFDGCVSLEAAAVGRWDVSGVTDMEAMFRDTGIYEAEVTDWDVSAVMNMSGMFYNCLNLGNMDLSKWQTHKELQYKDFCSSWTKVNDSNWESYFWGRQ